MRLTIEPAAPTPAAAPHALQALKPAEPQAMQATPPQAPPEPSTIAAPLATAPDAGVIEEAKRRRRRRHAGVSALTAAALLAGLAVMLSTGGNGNSPTSGIYRSPRRPLKLTFVHGNPYINGQPQLVGISPSLQAGNVGVCVMVRGGGSCNGAPPTKATPIYGNVQGFSPEDKVGPEGEIDTLFVGQRVAAVHVAHIGTFKARHYPGLPPGAREVIFYRPPGSRGTVLPPGLSPSILQSSEAARNGPALTETLRGASGLVIPVAGTPETFTLPNSYWQGTQAPPADGRCAISSSFPRVKTAWGQVTQQIVPNGNIAVPAWLTCVHVWFSAPGASFETALLLNAKAPGSAPAPLWGAVPVPGHPGIVEIPPVQREIHLPPLSAAAAKRILAIDSKRSGRAYAEQILRESERRNIWQVFLPAAVARRVGPAWLLVREGNSLQQRIAFLQSLRVTRMALH